MKRRSCFQKHEMFLPAWYVPVDDIITGISIPCHRMISEKPTNILDMWYQPIPFTASVTDKWQSLSVNSVLRWKSHCLPAEVSQRLLRVQLAAIRICTILRHGVSCPSTFHYLWGNCAWTKATKGLFKENLFEEALLQGPLLSFEWGEVGILYKVSWRTRWTYGILSFLFFIFWTGRVGGLKSAQHHLVKISHDPSGMENTVSFSPYCSHSVW